MNISGLPDKGTIETADGDIGYHRNVSGSLVWNTNGTLVDPRYIYDLINP